MDHMCQTGREPIPFNPASCQLLSNRKTCLIINVHSYLMAEIVGDVGTMTFIIPNLSGPIHQSPST